VPTMPAPTFLERTILRGGGIPQQKTLIGCVCGVWPKNNGSSPVRKAAPAPGAANKPLSGAGICPSCFLPYRPFRLLATHLVMDYFLLRAACTCRKSSFALRSLVSSEQSTDARRSFKISLARRRYCRCTCDIAGEVIDA
jgi:hypothetical protein